MTPSAGFPTSWRLLGVSALPAPAARTAGAPRIRRGQQGACSCHFALLEGLGDVLELIYMLSSPKYFLISSSG